MSLEEIVLTQGIVWYTRQGVEDQVAEREGQNLEPS
jgi:hypothetical protein